MGKTFIELIGASKKRTERTELQETQETIEIKEKDEKYKVEPLIEKELRRQLKAAFVTVDRKKMWAYLKKGKKCEYLIDRIKEVYKNTTIKVRMNEEENFIRERG